MAEVTSGGVRGTLQKAVDAQAAIGDVAVEHARAAAAALAAERAAAEAEGRPLPIGVEGEAGSFAPIMPPASEPPAAEPAPSPFHPEGRGGV